MNQSQQAINEVVREFNAASKEAASYYRAMTVEPPKVTKRFKEALEAYRKYLLYEGNVMPKQKYPYDRKDKSTWKYLDVQIVSRKFIRSVKNPDYKYK